MADIKSVGDAIHSLADAVGSLAARIDSYNDRRRADAMRADHWYTVDRIGPYKILEGAGTDGGTWKAEGRGESKKFKSRREAEEHASASQEE